MNDSRYKQFPNHVMQNEKYQAFSLPNFSAFHTDLHENFFEFNQTRIISLNDWTDKMHFHSFHLNNHFPR